MDDISTSYNKYVNIFIEQSLINGKTITEKELKKYKLPCVKAFLKYCPDSNVKSWNDFVVWCGLKPTNLVTKEQASALLRDYDKKINRPIMITDLNMKQAGVSTYIVKKYWGNLRNCQHDLGLKISPSNHQKSFEYYKTKLDSIINDLKRRDKLRITWRDIIYNKIGGFNYDSLKNAFDKENINLVNYIQDNGLTFWKSGQGKENYYVFPDGESTSSSYEYELTSFLKDNGFVYGRDYKRHVLYKDIIDTDLNNKINCDYVFYDTFAIEIAGLLTNKTGNWRNYKYASEREENYKEKMILKERLLSENKIPFLFLLPEDFDDECLFKIKIIEFIMLNLHKYTLTKKEING